MGERGFGSMGFLAPMMLLGATAVSVPLALHFFYKARYRPLPWAAMRFLKQSIEQTSRRLKFQEWLLLLLRCLCLLLLAAAIARPSCSAVAVGGRGEAVDAVLVFDTSFSMGARDGEATRFDRAKTAALTVIDNLPPNSTVQVVTAAERATPVGPHSPSNLDQARQLVQTLKLTSETGDVLAGLDEADRSLDRAQGSNKEVYLFTDLQKTGWDRQAGAIKAKAAELKQRAALIVVRCGNPDRPVKNVNVADITFPGGIPHSGTRLPVTVLVQNTGAEPLTNLTVALEVDGKPQETESGSVPEIAPGQTYPVSLTAKLDKPGAVLLTATVKADDLPGDNRLDRLIPVRDQLRVLVIDGAPDARDPKKAASHYLVNAIVPVSDSLRDDYFVRATVLTPDAASPGELGATDVCVLCNVPANGLSREFRERLVRFVKDGGGLVIGSGDRVAPAETNRTLGAAGVGLLPFDLTDPATGTPENPLKPAPDTTEAPGFLARFRQEPFSTVTADADVYKVVGFANADKPGAGRVLMRLTDGKPWLAAKVVGDGEVVFVGTSLDESWTNWPAKAGSFVSFVQFTLAHLTGKAARGANLTAGAQLVYHPTEATRAFDVVRPDGKRVRLGKASGGDGGGKLTVTYGDTAVAGVYRVGPEGQDPPEGPRFAVAPDLSESANLDSLGDAEVEQMIGFRPVLVLAGADGNEALANERNKREWTIWALLLLFGLTCGEMAWAWVCGRAW